MQATFARALLVLLACTSATHAMPNLVIEARADNAVTQVNAPDEAQLAQAKEQASQFLSAHQADTAAFADSLNKAQEAAKANGKELDISNLLNGLDLSGINLKDFNISAAAPAKADDSKADDTKAKADDTKAKSFAPWPYPGIGGFGGGYNNYYCYYCQWYPQYCSYCGSGGGGTVDPYTCYYNPQSCYGGYPYGGYNPYGLKPYGGKTSCGDLGNTDAEHYGFICNEAADTVKYCTVNPSGTYEYQKCAHKGSCSATDSGSFAMCLFG